jgi:hypothetical protein
MGKLLGRMADDSAVMDCIRTGARARMRAEQI